jgi:hypothetical protein
VLCINRSSGLTKGTAAASREWLHECLLFAQQRYITKYGNPDHSRYGYISHNHKSSEKIGLSSQFYRELSQWSKTAASSGFQPIVFLCGFDAITTDEESLQQVFGQGSPSGIIFRIWVAPSDEWFEFENERLQQLLSQSPTLEELTNANDQDHAITFIQNMRYIASQKAAMANSSANLVRFRRNSRTNKIHTSLDGTPVNNDALNNDVLGNNVARRQAAQERARVYQVERRKVNKQRLRDGDPIAVQQDARKRARRVEYEKEKKQRVREGDPVALQQVAREQAYQVERREKKEQRVRDGDPIALQQDARKRDRDREYQAERREKKEQRVRDGDPIALQQAARERARRVERGKENRVLLANKDPGALAKRAQHNAVAQRWIKKENALAAAGDIDAIQRKQARRDYERERQRKIREGKKAQVSEST